MTAKRVNRSKFYYLIICSLCACSHGETLSAWDSIKMQAMPQVALTAEFGTPVKQKLANSGWEDGVEISKDGLHLYCSYVPGDLLSWTTNNADPAKFSSYQRGPTFGLDLVSNPVGASSWIHSDILVASRASMNDPFNSWSLSKMARPVFSEGAPAPYDNTGFVFTSNDKDPTYDTDIWIIDGYPNPSGTGEPLPGFLHTAFTEDNPHMERLSDRSLVLFFDSDNYPNGLGSHDLWYSTSDNNGTTWSVPENVSTVNTADKEHQPYLFKDPQGNWYLYFSAVHSDGKLAIFRTKQHDAGNWNRWGPKELVISAGNTAGIGEPSLTENGDLSFVVVYENKDGSLYDRYDADPWFLPNKK